MTALSWLVYVRGFGNSFRTRTVLTSWCEEFLLTLQCWPLCSVQTFNSSHAAGLGALYTILNAYKGMVGLKVKPEMVLSVLRVIYSSFASHVLQEVLETEVIFQEQDQPFFAEEHFVLCVSTCHLLLRWTGGIYIAVIIYAFLV
jgi:hypothetical protein